MAVKTEYNIIPVAKPRQTRSDVWKQRPCVMKYRAFADECRASGMMIPDAGSHIIFILPMPKSWSAKKKKAMDGQPHQQVSDLDNMLKALLDSLFQDDSHIYDIRATKLWGYSGKIIVWKNNAGAEPNRRIKKSLPIQLSASQPADAADEKQRCHVCKVEIGKIHEPYCSVGNDVFRG